MDRVKIAYIGGGSKFVVTLLHGIAEYAYEFRQRKLGIELALFDKHPACCAGNQRYAHIVAPQTGVAIEPKICRSLRSAISGSDWVIYGPGLQAEIEKTRRKIGAAPRKWYQDVGPDLAISALGVWPHVSEAAGIAQRYAPDTLFTILVNPTDVLASAVQERFGLTTAGICVEVGGLTGFLCYYLGIAEEKLRLEYLGSNHTGWITHWTIGGRDGTPLLRLACDKLRSRRDWLPSTDWFLDVFELTGRLRTSPYHCCPFRPVPAPRYQQRVRAWMNTCLPGYDNKEQMRAAKLAEALKAGVMIPPFDARRVHPEATPYWYPNTRHILGGLAAGLCGAQCGPFPLQVRNGSTNLAAPTDAHVEVPVVIHRRALRPQRVSPPKDWMMQTMFLRANRDLAQWLAGGGEDFLTASLMSTAGVSDFRGIAEVLRGARKVAFVE